MNGGLPTLDGAENGVKVTISGNKIVYSGDDISFIYNADEGSMKSASGKYLSNSGNSNGLPDI